MTITTISAVTALSTGPALSLDDYDRIIGLIQDGALDTEQLSQALDELRSLFQANYISLILRAPSADSMGITLISGQPEWAGKLAHFVDYRWDAPMRRLPPDQVHCMDDLMSREEWDTILGIHLQGFFYGTRRAADIMVSQRSGNIISISSVSDLRAHENAAAYDAAKGAILAGTRAIAVDLGKYGIRVNAISPGPIYVENWDNFTTPEKLERAGQQIILRRIGRPEDVAGVAVFLASEDASFITGQTIYVDGGLSAQARPPGGQAT